MREGRRIVEATDPPGLTGPAEFSFERLLSHTEPIPAAEAEEFVRYLYEQRSMDSPAEPSGR